MDLYGLNPGEIWLRMEELSRIMPKTPAPVETRLQQNLAQVHEDFVKLRKRP